MLEAEACTSNQHVVVAQLYPVLGWMFTPAEIPSVYTKAGWNLINYENRQAHLLLNTNILPDD